MKPLCRKGREALADPTKYAPENDGGSGSSSGKWKKRLASILVCAVVAALYLSDGLRFAERQLDDIKFDLLSRPATDDLILVEIDARSINAFGVWPWPREQHAAAIDRLMEAGAARIAFDVDFSAHSSGAQDAALAQALESAEGKVVLPVFRRMASTSDDALIDVAPIDVFRRHVDLADLNVIPSSDGRVRYMFTYSAFNGKTFPSLAALLAGPDLPPCPSFAIDFAIDPATVPRLSFVDVTFGNFKREDVAGKIVIIGGTAAELGDYFAVPSHGTVPGALLHVLGYQSIVQGRALQRVSELPILVLVVGLVLGLAWISGRMTLLRTVGLAAATAGAVFGASLYLQAIYPVQIDTVPLLLAVVLSVVLSMANRLDQQSLRLLFQTFAIRRRDATMRNLIEKSIVGVIICDEDGRIESINGAAAAMFGYSLSDFKDTPLDLLIPDIARDDGGDALTLLQLAEGTHRETWGQRGDGSRFPMEIAANRETVDGKATYVAFVNDITLRRQQEEELEYRADHDELTGLPNRGNFSHVLEEILGEMVETGAKCAVFLLDLDRFKEVNDTLGHAVGDKLLQDVGRRLLPQMSDGAMLSRFGGDEFAMFLPHFVDDSRIEEFAGNIIAALKQPFDVDGLNLEVGGSIGYALYPDDGDTPDTLLQRADIAMYSAKRFQSGVSKYWAEDDLHSVRNLTLTGDLRRAIDEGELEIVIQPKVDLKTEEAMGGEVLCRWNRPDHGFVSPDEFIGHAEQSGLIFPLTQWVLGKAVETAAIWRELGWDLNIAVNLSARLLHHEQILSLVRDTLERWQYPPEKLTLEITENALLVNPGHAMIVISELAELGIKVSIDDFGTGYSSLSYLTTLAAKELKIDKSFVMGMAHDKNFKTVVKSVIAMAHDLDLRVVAEGIETDEAVEVLCQFGCDIGQGYLFGRPMSSADFEAWLMTWKVRKVPPDAATVPQRA